MSGEVNKETNAVRIVGNQTVALFEEHYLKSLQLWDAPTSNEERVLAQGAILKVMDYCTTNNIPTKSLNAVSIVTGIKQLIQTGLDPNMPENVYLAVYDGVVKFAPYKNGYIHLFEKYGLGIKRLVDI